MALDNPTIIIPAYNEATTIKKVISDLKIAGYDQIIVIDDGSTDDTFNIANQAGATVIRHCLNRGLGGALGTGISAALKLHADIIVTLDADGQHAISDVPRIIEPILKGQADVVIGSRLLNPVGMPWFRQIQNWIGNVITYLLFHLWVTDSQSGLRAFSRKAAGQLKIRTNRMEVSSEIIREIKVHHLAFVEVPIQAIYTDYSLSKGQSFLVGIKTVLKLILHKII